MVIALTADGDLPCSSAAWNSLVSRKRTGLKVSFGVELLVSKRISVTTDVIGAPLLAIIFAYVCKGHLPFSPAPKIEVDGSAS